MSSREVRIKAHLGQIGMAFVLLLDFGCGTAPPRPDAMQERVERARVLNTHLAPQLESRFLVRDDALVKNYFKKLLHSLTATAGTDGPDWTVSLIREKPGKHENSSPWGCYSLPEGRIFLSIDLIRNLKFENELAAVLALEVAHVLKGHLLDRVPAGLAANRSGPSALNELFTYPDSAQLEAAELAADLLYKTGYDPRGLAALWKHYLGNPEQAPYGHATLEKLVEKTHQVLAVFTPLRNPIVRSHAFLTVHQRILKL